MGQFRKKPVVVEAWQWVFAPGGEDPPSWVNDALNKPHRAVGSIAFWPDGDPGKADRWADIPHIAVYTLEGEMFMRPGDFLIRGVEGELYPCKWEIFTQTYEPVEAEPNPYRGWNPREN